MSNLSLALFFPSFSIQSPIGKLTYMPGLNMFTSQVHTSLAGNHYFEGIRISESLVVKVSFGIGWARDFINAIKIYSADGSSTLLAYETFNSFYFSHDSLKRATIDMMYKALAEANSTRRLNASETSLRQYATELVEQTMIIRQSDLIHTKQIPLLAGP